MSVDRTHSKLGRAELQFDEQRLSLPNAAFTPRLWGGSRPARHDKAVVPHATAAHPDTGLVHARQGAGLEASRDDRRWIQPRNTSPDMTQRPVATAPTAPHEPNLRDFVGLLREDWEAHLREWRSPGFQAILAYRLGRLRRALHPRWTSKPITALYVLLHNRARGRFGIELHDTAVVGRGVRIVHQNGIVIHRYAIIGDQCVIRHNVTIGSRNEWTREDVATIGKGVQLGVGSVIVGSLIIGDDARIGPNTVVLEDVPVGASVMPPRSEIRRRNALQPRTET